MRLRCYSWPKRLAVYSLCFILLMISYPRPARAFLPLLALAVPAGTATVSEVIAVTLPYVSYALWVAAGATVGAATVVSVSNELNRSTPSDLGNNLRSTDRVPAVGAAMVASGVVTPSAFNIELYKGKVVNVTSAAELAALSPKVSGADALYGTPSKMNPVPVLIPPLSPDYYPSVPADAVMSPSPNGVYNISSSGFDYSFNPEGYRYATAKTADDLLDLYIAGHRERFDYVYKNAVNDYKYFIDGCELCVNGGERPWYDNGKQVYTVLNVDSFNYPDLFKSVTHSTAREHYNINGSIISLPSVSSITVSVPPVIFNNRYKLDTYYRINNSDYILRSSEILNRYQEVQGFQLTHIDVYPNSSLLVKDNEKGEGAVIIPPLHTQPDIVRQLQGETLSSAQIASFINSAWQRASSKADYKGIPYSSSIAVTATAVNDVLDARGISVTMADLLAPVSASGYWDIPVYNITLNQYVSNTYASQVPEIDLGVDPKTQAPVLPSPSPMEVILAPITNILPFMHHIDLRSRMAACPVYELNIDYLNKRYVLDEHCLIINKVSPLISLFFTISWTMLSLFIVVRRRG